MTRIVGELYGPDGPLKGRLFLKPSMPFIGAPAEGLSFKIENGIVDIEVPANTASTVWLADWKDAFDLSPVTYIEQWKVPLAATVALEDVRGLGAGRRTGSKARTETLDAIIWKQKAAELELSIGAIEAERAQLLSRLSEAEARVAAEAGKAASLASQLSIAKQKLVDVESASNAAMQEVQIVEKEMPSDEARRLIACEREKAILLEQELQRTREELDARLSLATHFSSLHEEIDRLKGENQALRLYVEELKQPVRSTSSLRREVVANLDRLVEG